MSTPELLQFPTEFPIKVMGRRDGDLRSATQAIVEKHAGPLQQNQIRERSSAESNFLSVTYTIQADSRAQLDAIYRELTACPAVMMAL